MNERGTGRGAIGRMACSRGRACALTTVGPAAGGRGGDGTAGRTSMPRAAAASGPAPADLVVANRTIVTLRAPVSGASAAQRVEAISERLDALLAKGGTPIVSRTAVDGGYMIQVNGEPAFRILDADVDPDLHQTTAQVAEQATARLGQALAEIAEARNARAMLPALGWTLLATAVLTLCLWAVVRYIVGRRHGCAPPSSAGSSGTAQAGRVICSARRTRPPWRLPRCGFSAGWSRSFSLYTWTGFVLQRFPYTRPWGEALRDNLFAALGDFGASVVRAIPGLLFVVLIFAIARVAVRIVRALFDAAYAGRVDLGWIDQTTARPTGQLLSAVIWLFALVAAYPYIPGSDSEAFRGVGVFVGLMLSIGSSGIVNQAVSGMMLMYTRSLRPGEFVQIGETEGTVTSIGFMTTRLETVRREEISIPNAVIAANVMRNYSRLAPDGRGARRDQGEHRLRHPLAAGARDAAARGRAHKRTGPRYRTARAADGAARLLRRIHAPGCGRRPLAPCAGAERAQCQHPGRLQRERRADHDAQLRGRSRGTQGGRERGLVPHAGAAPGARHGARTRRWRYSGMSHSLRCWKCGASLAELSLPLRRTDECRACRAELHVCLMCEFYDTTVAKSCRETIAEEVKDKQRANFCDYFRPSDRAYRPGDQSAADKAKAELEALFGRK